MRSGVLSSIKQLLVLEGETPRTIKTGPFRGLKMNLDLASQTQLYLGLFEREVYTALTRLSSGVSSAVDIGIAHGEYTLYFLARTQAAKVFGFEPSEEGRAKLLANLELNDLAHDARLSISAKFVATDSSESACNLDSLLSSITLPCLIKMDVDGGEAAVLSGARGLLQLPRVRWLIETHSAQLEQNCISTLTQSGYETRIIPNAWWRFFLPDQRPGEHNRWLIASKRADIHL